MDYQWAATGLLGIVCAIGGWLLRTLWGAVDKLKDDLKAVEVRLPTEYVAKSDLAGLRADIMARFDKLEEKLDGKADRER